MFLHSDDEDGSQKKDYESACQFHRIDIAYICTRALMKGVVSNELHVFLTSKNTSFVHMIAHGVESPHVSRGHVKAQTSNVILYTLYL